MEYSLESAKYLKQSFYLFYNDIPKTDIICDYDWICEFRAKCQKLAEFNYTDEEHFIYPLLDINKQLYWALQDYAHVKDEYKLSDKSCYRDVVEMYNQSGEFIKQALIENWGIS